MRALALGLVVLGGCAAQADAPSQTCRSLRFDAAPFIVCTVPRTADIRLHLRGEDGQVLGDFETLATHIGAPMKMAMNAGMYHADRAPVGLYVEGGVEAAALVTRPGPGNFGMVPNGVFWSDGTQVHVSETLAFASLERTSDFATQSGPMLVIDGELHPRFLPQSESRKRRNGVGVDGDTVWFAISDAPVSFHHFARLFRDELGAANALFLDGSISRIRAPELDRDERGAPLGPMVVIVAETETIP